MPYRRPLYLCLLCLWLALYLHPVFFVGCFILLMDMSARYKDHERIKGKPFNRKLAREFGHSWCGRGVCEYEWPEAKNFYYSKGYRWYHIVPDGFPVCLIKLSFWKSVVGYNK